MRLWVDGQFVDESDARLSVFDAGLQHGVGLFETMRAYRGRVFDAEAHLKRLIDSAEALGLGGNLQAGPLSEAVERTLKENDLAEARVRLTVTGGDLSLLAKARGQQAPGHRPSIFIQATAPSRYPESYLKEGVAIAIADARANPFDPTAGHKTLHYWPRLRELSAAAARGAAESLWLSVTNHLCGGSVSNVLLIKDRTLQTPFARGEEVEGALPAPVLPGTVRARAIELAESMGLTIERKMLSVEDALGADEMILTNSSWLLMPVVSIEGRPVGGGSVGPWSGRLYEALLGQIDQACAP